MNQHTPFFVTMNCGKIDVRRIHPKDNRFSPNLYKWARKEKRCGFYRLTKRHDVYPKGTLFVGSMHNGDFWGNLLMRVFCWGTRREAESVVYIAGLHDEFISLLQPAVSAEKAYLKHGRCGLYPNHNKDFIGQWTYDGDRRTCNFCGKVYVKTKVGEHVVEEFDWKEA